MRYKETLEDAVDHGDGAKPAPAAKPVRVGNMATMNVNARDPVVIPDFRDQGVEGPIHASEYKKIRGQSYEADKRQDRRQERRKK